MVNERMDMITKNTLKSALVVQHNALIESCYRMTLNEKRIVLAFISQLKRKTDSTNAKRKMLLSVEDFNNTFHTTLNAREMKNAVDLLYEKSISTSRPYTDPDGRVWKYGAKFRLIDCALYSDAAIQVSFSEYAMPLLENLTDQFTKYSLKDATRLTSIYAVRFFELFKQFQAIGERTMMIAEIREMFDLKEKYKRPQDFFRRVIEAPIKEIKANTEMKISYVQKKEKRRIVGYTFTFSMEGKSEAEKYRKAVQKLKRIYKTTNRICIGGILVCSISFEKEEAYMQHGIERVRPLFELLHEHHFEWETTDFNGYPVKRK